MCVEEGYSDKEDSGVDGDVDGMVDGTVVDKEGFEEEEEFKEGVEEEPATNPSNDNVQVDYDPDSNFIRRLTKF